MKDIKFDINSQPKLSNWSCYMFGSNPEESGGFIYTPVEKNLPNKFVRYMMKICFACTWVKKDNEEIK